VWLKSSVLGVGEGVCLSVDEGFSLGVVEVVAAPGVDWGGLSPLGT
jgi:hypothetical protein